MIRQRVATVAGLALSLAALVACSGTEGPALDMADGAAFDMADGAAFDIADVPAPPPRDTDGAAEDTTSLDGGRRDVRDEDGRSDAASDAPVAADVPATIDVGRDAGPAVCRAPANVVASGLAIDVEVDLSRFAAREYAVRQRVVLVPDAAGEAVSLYGVSFLMGPASVPYSYDGNRVTFCTGPFEAGDAVTIEAEYVISEAVQGFPPGSLAGMRVWGQDGGLVIGPYSTPFFASTWLLAPQTMTWFDRRHDGNVVAERVDLAVIVPDDGWTVVGPGEGHVEGTTWRFALDRTVPLYAVSFAASPAYETLSHGPTRSGVTLTAGVTPASRAGMVRSLEVAAATIDWMADRVGPFAWGPRLAFAEIPTFSGGMEHAGAVWLGTRALAGDATGDYVAVHETVHHWWGNRVRIADWQHFWLSEGLTEWTTVFAVLGTTSDPVAARSLQDVYRERAAATSYPQAFGAPTPGPLRFADDSDIMTQVANNLLFFYYYGASFLHMVDRRLARDFGTDLVTLLPAWYGAHAGEAVTTEELLAFLVDRTGAADVWERLFAEWVYVGPAPTLEARAYTFADGEASLTLARTAGAGQDLSSLVVAFVREDEVVFAEAGLDADVEEVSARGVLTGPPDRVVIDPDGLYILRLRTASGYAGPDLARSL